MEIYKVETNSELTIGMLTPAGRQMNLAFDKIDLNKMFGSRTNVLVKVRGESEIEDVCDGDILIADRAKIPRTGDIIIAQISTGYTIRRHRLRAAKENDGHFATVTWIFKAAQ